MLPQGVRIKFGKKNLLKYISHLDVCRTMKSALLRSRVPVWYTEGFNPHPKMVFSLPLSIGTESECEYMDIKITHEMPFDEVRDRLAAALTADMPVVNAYAPEMKFTEIGWARYEITPHEAYDLDPLFAETVMITKRTKKGEVTLDIKDRIGEIKDLGQTIEMTLAADSEKFLNPDHLMTLTGCGDYRIVRKNVYTCDMRDFR